MKSQSTFFKENFLWKSSEPNCRGYDYKILEDGSIINNFNNLNRKGEAVRNDLREFLKGLESMCRLQA